MQYSLEKRADEFDAEFNSINNYCEWLFNERFFPVGLLPASFCVKNASINANPIINGSGSSGRWRSFLKISPPDDKFTSTYFGVHHPDALHDFLHKLKSLDLKKLLKQSSRITSYSLPLPARPNEQDKVRGVSDYLKLEEDITADAWDFSILIKLDIKHCYPSIYSHSLHWAVDGYANVRPEDPVNLTVGAVAQSGEGKHIDRLVSAMHGGITKGIAVGPGASDLVAELLFRVVDEEISLELTKKNIEAIGGRYKDDYRILVKEKKCESEVIEIVQGAIAKYLLHLNEDKTRTGHPFEILQRDWMVEYHTVMSDTPSNLKQFLWHLSYVADLQEKYPGKRLLAKYLSKLRYQPKNIDEMHQVASVLLSLSDVFRSTVPFAISYIEHAAEKIQNHNLEERILNKLLRETNPYNGMWYLHYLATYVPDYKTKVSGNIDSRIEENVFWKSLFEQQDLLFSNSSTSATFFTPVPQGIKIYQQTQMFADLY